MKKVVLIWAHPRVDSLTAKVADAMCKELDQHGVTVREMDLYRMGFDPVLREDDEPHWSNPDKVYSAEVMDLAKELRDHQAAFVVFPVWWYSMPAILKGYIDRVWNHGISYGAGHKLPFSVIRWVALAGEPQASFVKRGLNQSMSHQLNVGIAGFCGALDSQVEFLYDTLGEEADDIQAHHHVLQAQARALVTQLVSNSDKAFT